MSAVAFAPILTYLDPTFWLPLPVVAGATKTSETKLRGLIEDGEVRAKVDGRQLRCRIVDVATCLEARGEPIDHGPPGWIYFVQLKTRNGPIKIGYATDVRKRVRGLACSSPWPIVILHAIQGDLRQERELHQKFGKIRMQGEWFRSTPQLRRYIERLKVERPI